MRTLLVDNYDSFTYNLYHLIAQVNGKSPVVVRNDDPGWSKVDLDEFDGVVISPGPGHPASPRDFGHSRAVLAREDLPVLGVCLGHQGIGLVAGAQVLRAPEPRHGYLTRIDHRGRELFAGLPQKFTAVRYHSLCVAQPLPEELEAVAWAEDGLIMALRHRRLPRWGVQFHPESISTEYGAQLLENFRRLALERARPRAPRGERVRTASANLLSPNTKQPKAPPSLQVHVQRLDRLIDAEGAFTKLFGQSNRAFWLDSARVEPGLSRFSFFGEVTGDAGEMLSYRVHEHIVRVESATGEVRTEAGTIFEALERRLQQRVAGSDELPFHLPGGYVGYFGYELKAHLGGSRAHRAETPDAVWLRADHLIAVDHLERRTYLVAVVDPTKAAAARSWLEHTALALRDVPDFAPAEVAKELPSAVDVAQWLVRSREQYLKDIEACQAQLHAGESYEICLTNKLRLRAPPDDLTYYKRLRRLNPAPYAAFLRLGDVSIFCSSPERFLRIDDKRGVESKPIKGTAPRNPDPQVDERLRAELQSDPKTRAENLMIVDLLRNDLGQVCELGSVCVPSFMATESYATVHQLVSTIRGKLRRNVTPIACVAACFPGGSMTGAPKLRTMEIIDGLENEARGVYSGTLGYLGFAGTADLNIVIRTAVRCGGELTVGAGGAIVLDSNSEAEYEEMLLKAKAPLRALP
ncbi:MAG: aminodeoxychorismate synthase component I [Myxococcota bacterium]